MKLSEIRPYIICHMIPSVDGRIVTRNWDISDSGWGEYDRTAATFHADGWLVGRVSMAPYAGKSFTAHGENRISRAREDYVADTKAQSFAVVLDPSGKLAWKSNYIDEDHVISIVSGSVSDGYLSFLRKKEVSYLIAGSKRIDLKRAMIKLHSLFGIRRLLLEGGGKINGSMLSAGLIDEISVLLAPIADGSVGTPSLFDSSRKGASVRLNLISSKRVQDDILWIRYRTNGRREN